MEHLIALIIMFFEEPAEPPPPKYSFGHCYKSPDAEYRPNVIGVRHNKDGLYTYRVWYGRGNGWSKDLHSKIQTIESVYSLEIRCP